MTNLFGSKPKPKPISTTPQPQTPHIPQENTSTAYHANEPAQHVSLINKSLQQQRNQPKDHHENTSQKIRLTSIKYKVYLFFVILLIVVFYDPLMDEYNDFLNTQNAVDQLDTQIATTISNGQRYQQDSRLLVSIEQQKAAVIGCINFDSGCDDLSMDIQENIDVIRYHLQLHSLATNKMVIDERKILKNINEFLLQDDPFREWLSYNGTINSIVIGNGKKIFQWLSSIPVTLGITFTNKDALLSFIDNVENRIFYSEGNQTDYALAMNIQSLQYDIVNYQNEQTISIKLSLYYLN